MTVSQKYIAEVVVGLPVEGPFDYVIGQDLRDQIQAGMRVLVSFNRRKMVGFVVGFKEKSAFEKLNTIIKLLDKNPALDNNAVELTRAVSQYYGCSWGEAIETYLPPYLRKNKEFDQEVNIVEADSSQRGSKKQLVVDKSPDKRWVFIKDAVSASLSEKRGVIFLVPEVQMIEGVLSRLKKEVSCPIYAFNTKMKPADEFERWVEIKKQGFCVVVGSRSTVFAPVANLGLTVVYDQENDAYKQEQVPHYNANQVALMRSEIEGSDLIYVSSAPSAELWLETQNDKIAKVIIEADKYSDIQFVDMNNYNPQKTSLISAPLQNSIYQFLEDKKRIVLLINRRGHSTFTQCNQCGYVLKCPRCDVSLTFMSAKNIMVCRRCNYHRELPKICPGCNGSYLRSSGTGIEKLESQVSKYYQQARVAKYDKETRKFPVNADIVIATQAILKRKDDVSVDLIAVINFDSELNHFDFRSGSKAFSFLVNLRQMAKEKLIIQTRMMDNYCLNAVTNMFYDGFYKEELNSRRELGFPPFRQLISLVLRGTDEAIVLEQAKVLYNLFKDDQESKSSGIEVMDLHPDAVSKLRDKYRYAIVLKGEKAETMQDFIKKTLKNYKRKKGTILTVNVE